MQFKGLKALIQTKHMTLLILQINNMIIWILSSSTSLFKKDSGIRLFTNWYLRKMLELESKIKLVCICLLSMGLPRLVSFQPSSKTFFLALGIPETNFALTPNSIFYVIIIYFHVAILVSTSHQVPYCCPGRLGSGEVPWVVLSCWLYF